MKYDFVVHEIVAAWGGSNADPFDRWSEEVKVVVVDEATLAETQQCVVACERCAENATITFAYLLDAITGCDPATDYLICRPTTCPCCSANLTEKTRVVA